MNIPLGTALSVLSSALFGVLYYYATLLHPLAGTEVFGWRMLLTLPVATIVMLRGEARAGARDILGRVRRRPALALGLCASSAMIGVQQWLFLWAPMNGAALNVSLGYFLLPLVILLAGWIVYRDRLTRWQVMAAAVAAVGVAHELHRVGTLSWETVLVALGMTAYFVWRRWLGTNTLAGFWLDLVLMAPVALALVIANPDTAEHVAAAPQLLVLLPGLAVLSAAAFISYMLSSRYLPLSLFGLLGYVEPLFLFGVAFLIGEQLKAGDILTYGPIMLAVGLLMLDGILTLLMPKPTSSRGGVGCQTN